MIMIDGFEIDAALREDHSFDSEVTEYPVEEGADVADHIRPRPITVTIEGVVSDDGIGPVADRREEGVLPSDDAFDKLESIRDKREPVNIITSLRNYTDMMLQSLSAPRDSSTGHAFRFTATFVQLQFVTNERTTVRVSEPRAAKKQGLGNKPATPVATAPKTQPTVNTAKEPIRGVKAGDRFVPPGIMEIDTFRFNL